MAKRFPRMLEVFVFAALAWIYPVSSRCDGPQASAQPPNTVEPGARAATEEPTREELESVNASLETVREVCRDTLSVILSELKRLYPGISARQSQGRSKHNDYRNYQWISVKIGDSEYLVTIHHNNIDLRTGNPHTQYGRVQFWKCAGPNGPHTRDAYGVWRFRYDNAWNGLPRLRVWDDDYSSTRVAELFGEFLRVCGEEDALKAFEGARATQAEARPAADLPASRRKEADVALENIRVVCSKAMYAIVREARSRHPDWKIRTSHGNSRVNDYRNYLWITVRTGGRAYWITMMANDLDSFTGNTHTQYGRIQFWRDINHENGPKNEAGPHTRDHGAWRFRYDKQWRRMPRLHVWHPDYSSARVVDLFEEFLAECADGQVGGGASVAPGDNNVTEN